MDVPFSDLQLRGKATVEAWLHKSANRYLVVRRRDAEDLVLTTASRAAQARETSSVTSRLLVALMQQDPVRDVVDDVIPQVFPWVSFLSRDEAREFVIELTSTMKAAESIDNPAPVAQLIDAWRHTAEVLADPELVSVLAAPSDGDFGSVPLPGTDR
ncbi:MAG: hypothetical protein WBH51_18005 [Mycolicibacter algericus]|uniref:Prevent-host-death family protein n=2 Tax=Mycolicibacter algericus TaxID=1288388 RepID=A0A7I9Y560_MYCAL|nr:hypothetical protein [Mycolicibacter algericus]OQZ92916.1 hypothetical protein BST10_20610 [Mycolicibacter algericus DSM 45454]GFG83820.1 hypothetical protein MALGJ_04960 [Mycolicibacter algericus]